MGEPLFDLRELHRAIDEERQRRGLSWAALSRAVGVSSSTIQRFGQADDAEADGVLNLVSWLGVVPEAYMRGDSMAGQLLPSTENNDGDGAYVRVDMELVAKASGDRRGARGRSRTTIQALAETAQRSGQSVASLTRLSDT